MRAPECGSEYQSEGTHYVGDKKALRQVETDQIKEEYYVMA